MVEKEDRRCQIGMIAGFAFSCQMEMIAASVRPSKLNANKR
jgi:hypothetical protein